jgi:hypothetical protein
MTPDDVLAFAARSLNHDTRGQEVRVRKIHSCLCGARDWEAGEWWDPLTRLALRFTCRGCGCTIPVSELLLQPERTWPEGTRPRDWEHRWPCPCGRSMMRPDTDWIGPECACCGAVIYYDVSNPARPLCDGCQPNSKADEIVGLAVDGTVDRRLRWLERGRRVRVIIARAVPRLGPAGQRLGGERLRGRRIGMARAVNARMRRAGWTCLRTRFDEPNDYEARAVGRSPAGPPQSPGTAAWAW